MVAVALSAGCTVPTEPWEPAQESPEAAQAWQKARLQVEKPRWIFVETQFVEWGMLPPDPVKPLLGGDDFNAGERPRPQQTLLQEEENPEIDPPKEWGSLSRRQLFVYVQKPVAQGPWSHFRIGWLTRRGQEWSRQLQLEPPMRVRCKAGAPGPTDVLQEGQFTPLAINADLDRSGNGGANLQVLIPQLIGWICRQRQAAATEALKPLVVER
jgi:hypothetical protein